MNKKFLLLIGTLIGIAIITIAYFVTVRKNTSPFPINSPKSAAIAIDQLAQAIEDKDQEKAVSLLATRNGAEGNQDAVLYAIGSDQETANNIIQLLRSRRFLQKYHFSQETFYLFEVTWPTDFKTSTIRVHQYSPDDGVYSDEGIEFN